MKNEHSKKEKPVTTEVENTVAENPVAKTFEHKQPSHSGGAIWAVVLISIGLIFLLNNLGLLPWEVWSNIWRFWPVILILLGLQLVFGRNWFSNLIIAIVGVVLILVILSFSVASVNTPFRDWSQEKIPFWRNIQRMMEEGNQEVTTNLEVLGSKYQNVAERRLKVDIGSARFDIQDEEVDSLLRVVAIHPENSGKPRIRESFANNILTLDFDTVSEHGMFFFGMARREYDLSLGQPNLPTSISLDLGSGSGKFDFENLNLKDIKIDQGSGELKLDFADTVPSGEFSINLGSGNISINLPADIGFVVKYTIGSGNLKIGSSSVRGEGTFTSQNFGTAEKKLEIGLELGSGNVSINP